MWDSYWLVAAILRPTYHLEAGWAGIRSTDYVSCLLAGVRGVIVRRVPWHAVALLLAGLALIIAVEITLAFGIAKLATGHAY